MTALGLICMSVVLGVISGLSAPEISDKLVSTQLRIAVGLAVFVVVQFGLITPFRMWRKSAWVANVEEALQGLWDLHEQGVSLLNEHGDFMQKTPDWKSNTDITSQWVDEWVKRVESWMQDLEKALTAFSPIEARRLRNLVTYEKRIQGLNNVHEHHLNILRERLVRLGNALESSMEWTTEEAMKHLFPKKVRDDL